MNKRMSNTMYKTVTNVVTITLIILCFVIAPSITGWIDTHYTMTCEVNEINGDIITVIDGTNNLWDFCGEGFHKGDRVKVTFFNNTTDHTRYDDEIVKIKKIEK